MCKSKIKRLKENFEGSSTSDINIDMNGINSEVRNHIVIFGHGG